MSIQMPDIKAPQLDKHIANKTISLRLAMTTRQTVIANIEKGTANLRTEIKAILATCLEEVLSEPERVQAFYWCASSADDIEKDIFDRVQRRMSRKMQAQKGK